jgi:hypothetical protein
MLGTGALLLHPRGGSVVEVELAVLSGAVDGLSIASGSVASLVGGIVGIEV